MNIDKHPNGKHVVRRGKLKGVVAFSLAAFACTSQAEIIGYEGYTNAGETKQVLADAVYVNMTSELAVNVSAGLERKINVKVFDESGGEIINHTTDVVGGTDTFYMSGDKYFGKSVSIDGLGEGVYAVTADILDSSGSIVSSFQEDLVIDRTAPTVSGEFYWNLRDWYQRIHTDGQYIVSTTSSYDAGFTDVDDALSGVGKVTFTSTYLTGPKSGEVYSDEYPGLYTEDGRAIIGNGTRDTITSKHMPYESEEMTFTFHIYDKAGNVVNVSEDVYVANALLPDPEPWAIYTGSGSYDGFEGYVKYELGMAIYENPVKMIYRMSADNHIAGNARGEIYGGWLQPGDRFDTSYIRRETEDYVFLEIEGTSSGTEIQRNQKYIQSPRSWRDSIFFHNLTFGNEESRPPVGIKIEAYVDALGAWVPSNYGIGLDQAGGQSTISKIRVSVEARPYLQRYYMSFQRTDQYYSGISCEIPAGEEQCVIEYTLPYPDEDVNVYHGRYFVKNEDGTMFSNELVPVWMYLGTKPEIYSSSISEDENSISVTTKVPYQERAWAAFKTEVPVLKFTEQSTGNTQEVVGNLKRSEGTETTLYEDYDFDYSSIPDGVYDATVEVVGILKNRGGSSTTTELLFTGIEVDTTGPNIEYNISSGREISSLKEIELTASDNVSSVTFESVRLQGGPNHDDFLLSLREENGVYKLEYPVMFPSLEAGDIYTLTAKAVDESSNVGSASVTFMFSPERVSLKGGDLTFIPSITNTVFDSDGNTAISTNRYTDSNGQPIQGTYPIDATLSTDADYELVINGVTLHAGETKTVSEGYDFSANDGYLNLPVYPANAGDVGKAGVILTPTFPDAPISYGEVGLWDAETNIVGLKDFYYAKDGRYEFEVALTSSTCQKTNIYVPVEEGSMFTAPKCLLEIYDEPQGTFFRTEESKIIIDEITQANTRIPYRILLLTDSGQKIAVKEGTHSIKFLPRPVDFGQMTTFAVSEPLRYDDGQPVAAIKTGTITDAAGKKAVGPHLFKFTLNNDASYPVVIRNNVVNPGESVYFMQNLSQTNNEFNADIYPALDGVSGTANFVMEIEDIWTQACPDGFEEQPSSCTKVEYEPAVDGSCDEANGFEYSSVNNRCEKEQIVPFLNTYSEYIN